MDDHAFATALEDGSLPPEEFNHRGHLRFAWHCLGRMSFGCAGDHVSAAVRRFAAAHAKPSLFHETITWAYLALIRERSVGLPVGTEFAAFAEANPDLLDHRTGALSKLYDADTLLSDVARRVFVLPRPRAQAVRGQGKP